MHHLHHESGKAGWFCVDCAPSETFAGGQPTPPVLRPEPHLGDRCGSCGVRRLVDELDDRPEPTGYFWVEGAGYAPPIGGALVEVVGPHPQGLGIVVRPLSRGTGEPERITVCASALRPANGRGAAEPGS